MISSTMSVWILRKIENKMKKKKSIRVQSSPFFINVKPSAASLLRFLIVIFFFI